MLFFNLWDRVLHLLVPILLTQVIPAQTSQKRVIPVDVCGQSALTKWRRCGEQMKLVGSSSLELQMQLTNLATSIVESAARTIRCWRMAHMKSWDTFRVSNILLVTSDWDWTHLAGEFWTLRETTSVKVSWSAKGSAFLEVLRQFGIESIILLTIWLWTTLEPRTPRWNSLSRRWLKCCDWAAPTGWSTNCGRNSR